MKQKLNKLIKKLNNSMFDVAAAPMFLAIFGLPVLLIVVVGALIGLAYSKISQIHQERNAAEKKDEEQ